MNELPLFDRVRSSIRCSDCGELCDPANIDVLGFRENIWLFSAYCSSCNSRGLIMISIEGCREHEVDAELTEGERSELSSPVNSSDVLDMHLFLEDFCGDIGALRMR